MPKDTETYLSDRQLAGRYDIARPTIWVWLKKDPTFPKPVSVGARAVGWVEAEVEAWLIAQIQKSRAA